MAGNGAGASASSTSGIAGIGEGKGSGGSVQMGQGGRGSGQQPTSSSNPAAKGISSSTKTSGTSNLVSGGGSQGNSLTGKNPFAILKASAIASTSTAKFPNNFTNLPKVTPPFLPALEGEAKQKTYTLVLDLDETLIHNVEYGSDSYFLVRPGCVYFIELMAKFYEIVIFTAALQDYADQVID